MPTYEYACTACAQHIEVVQRFTDSSLTECPSCAGRLRKVFSPVGVVFKGSGFYKNDSRDSSKSAKKSESGASGSSPKSAGDTTSSDKGSSTADSGGSSAGKSTGESSSPSPANAAPGGSTPATT